MSVRRRDVVRYLEMHGFHLLKEGAKHAIYTNGTKVIPLKRQKQFDALRPMKSASRPDWSQNSNFQR